VLADCYLTDWQDISSAKTLGHPGELEATIGDLVEFFYPPDLALSDHSIAAEIGASKFLIIRWTQGDAVKILNWTNRTVILDVQQQPSAKDEDSEQYIASDDSDDEWTARGQVVAPLIKSDDRKATPAVIRSLPRQQGEQELPFEEPTFDHGRSDGSSITVSLTRTRWCTSIKKDLMATIKARRVD
jgi:hypothetical protein